MIYLARHGQTDWNLFKRFNGATETFLNQTGIQQAKWLAARLVDVRFDACFCSPQTRARQCCEILYSGAPVFDDRLAEILCGAFEGTEETAEAMRQFWQAIQTGQQGTERLDAFVRRNRALCALIDEEYKGKNILIVTHAANARILHHHFSGQPGAYDFSASAIESGGMCAFENN